MLTTKRIREVGEKGTNGYLPAKAADTSLSLEDLWSTEGGLSSTYKHWWRSHLDLQEDDTRSKQRSRLELRRGQDKGYNPDGCTHCTRNKLQIQTTVSIWAKEGNNLPGQTDTEMREWLIQSIVQNKEQQDQIKVMILVLEEVLAQQTTVFNKWHATELLWESESEARDSYRTSNEETKEVVNHSGQGQNQIKRQTHAEPIMFWAMLPTTDLDGSNES